MSVVEQYFRQLLDPANAAVRELPFSSRDDFAAAFTIHCTDAREIWLIEIKDDHLVSARLVDAPADLGFILDSEAFSAIVAGQLAVQKAFLTGKVKVRGNMFRAMSLSRLLGAFFNKLAAASGAAPPAAVEPQFTNDFSEEVMKIKLRDGCTVSAVLGYDDEVRPEAALFIFPPHPLLGGDCDNNVVNLLYAAAVANGQLAVKFNYRLVDRDNITSQAMLDYWRQCDARGSYDEVVAACVELVKTVVNEIDRGLKVDFAAYSFGCYTALLALEHLKVRNFIGVSPPLREYDFETLFAGYSRLNFIIADRDEFCPVECFAPLADRHDINLQIVTPSDHFFRDSATALKQACLTIMENNYAQNHRRKS